MEPIVALMRRYCIDYTSGHDLSVIAEVMEPDYVLRMGGHVVTPRDGPYRDAVLRQFEQFPGLALTVEEIVLGADRLAMRFAEHGASPRHAGAVAAWQGIALYRWNGRRLTECRVEQDYFARRRQLETAAPNPVPRPAHDPWAVTPGAPSPAAERAVADWLRGWSGGPDERVTADDSWAVGWAYPVVDGALDVEDLFSAGETVAFYASRSGAYAGGLAGLDDRLGAPVRIRFAGLARVRDDAVDAVTLVSDRHGLVRQLRATAV